MRQTTRINGARVVINTTKSGKVTITPANHTEDELQAAQVAALRRHQQFNRTFTLAADMNAERRGPKARAKALKTGMTAGEPDVRLYFAGGRLVSVENKVGNGPLSPAQKGRHTLLRSLGFTVHLLRATTPDDAAEAMLAIVDDELAALGKAA